MERGWCRHRNGEEYYYTSEMLDRIGIRHLFSTRLGGVSKGCFGGWNFAAGVGTVRDTEENVLASYERAAAIFGLHAGDICRSYQTHTDLVLTVGEEQRGVGTTKPKFSFGVDGLVSETPDLLLSVRSADCVPILLADVKQRVCAAVHSGWRGTAAGIVKNAVEEMQRHGCRPEDIYAAIGPCIGACCYEVGEDVYAAFFAADPRFQACFTPKGGGKYVLDLTEANRLWLRLAGLPKGQIAAARHCTCCDAVQFFSHRRMGALRGTMSALITV